MTVRLITKWIELGFGKRQKILKMTCEKWQMQRSNSKVAEEKKKSEALTTAGEH